VERAIEGFEKHMQPKLPLFKCAGIFTFAVSQVN